MLVTQTYHTKMNVVYYMKIPLSYQYMFIYQACKTKMFLCKIINTVHGSTTTCQCETFHVASLCSPESNDAFLCQHIKGHRINTLQTTNRIVVQCSVHAWICDSTGRTKDFITNTSNIIMCAHWEKLQSYGLGCQISNHQGLPRDVSNNKICMHYTLSSALLCSHHSPMYSPSYSFRYTIHCTSIYLMLLLRNNTLYRCGLHQAMKR